MNTRPNPAARQHQSVPRLWQGVTAWIVTFLLGNAFAQASSEAMSDLRAPEANYATIIIKRHSGFFGQDGERYAIDRGSGVTQDAIIVETSLFPDAVGDFCIPQNVVYFWATRPDEPATPDFAHGAPPPIIGRSLRPNLAPNAAVVGKFDSHGILTWQRPAGRMRLELINLNGNQSVCAPVEVEAGKTYVITIRYSDHIIFEVKLPPLVKPTGKG